MTDTLIKPELDIASPGVFADDALYEDTHDELEFDTNPHMQSVILGRLPKELWETWAKLPDDAEVQIGTMRVVETVDENGNGKQALHLLLSSAIPQHQILPREYELDLTESNAQNVFLFTEQNLPGYKKGSYERDRENNIPAKFRTKDKKFEPGIKDENGNPKKRKEGGVDYRKPVPKRTRIAGKVKSEFTLLASEEEIERALIRRMQQVKDNAARSIYHNSMINQGMLGSLDRFANFVRTDQPTGPVKPQILKAARMPLNELRDAIFACFRQYKYWSMKALRNKLQQPEAYLRETLDGMATLARSGAFTGNWFLKPETSGYVEGMGLDALAPVKDEGGETSVNEDEGDDGEVDFEDVVAP